MAFSGFKKNKLWILKAVDRDSGRTVAWVTGGRDIATVKRLYAKLAHCRQAVFYTDHWEAFAAVLPADRHIIGKAHTVAIERNNSNTRHYLGRFTRKTKIVSRSETMVNITLKLWWHLAECDNFHRLAAQFRAMLI